MKNLALVKVFGGAAVTAAVGLYALSRHRKYRATCLARLRALEETLAAEREFTSELTETLTDMAADLALSNKPDAPEIETYLPIGYVKSCYVSICCTPRNAALVKSARAEITLDKNISNTSLEGMKEFSHLWVVFVFHKNNNKDKVRSVWSDPGYTFRSKVRVPRNNKIEGDGSSGVKVGCFATRTPHRPNPIGLTLAKIERVDMKTRTIHLLGSDLLDGTPVLDIKPYVACYDNPTVLDYGEVKVASFSDYTTFKEREVVLAKGVEEEWKLLAGKLRLYKGNWEECLKCVKQTLACDLSRGETLKNPLKPYVLEFDGCVVEYVVEGQEESYKTVIVSVRRARKEEGGGKGRV